MGNARVILIIIAIILIGLGTQNPGWVTINMELVYMLLVFLLIMTLM